MKEKEKKRKDKLISLQSKQFSEKRIGLDSNAIEKIFNLVLSQANLFYSALMTDFETN